VLLVPMPRSDTAVAPGVLRAVGWMSPPDVVGVRALAGENCGSLLRLDSSEAVLDCSSSASPTVTIGLFAS
jgi:hypothetical protein